MHEKRKNHIDMIESKNVLKSYIKKLKTTDDKEAVEYAENRLKQEFE